MANNRVTLPKDAERARAASSVEIPNSLQDVASPQVQTIPAYKEPGAPKIPQNLSPDEQSLYQTLIEVKKSRGIESRPTPEVVVITDLAKDYDDLSAMIILKELHRLGLIRLRGFVANLHPPKDRARFGRGCLDYLGLQDIPICWGEEAEANPRKWKDPSAWEFPYDKPHFKDFPAQNLCITPYGQTKANEADHLEIESGLSFLERMVEEKIAARKENPDTPKLTFLLLSGLADIATLAKRNPEKLASATNIVVLQGDYKIEQGPTSCSTILAANNAFDTEASTSFHKFMEQRQIPSIVFTRAPAFAARLDSKLFSDLNDTGHPLGIHLAWAEKLQDTTFYHTACTNPFLPHLDREWFLRGKTDFYEIQPSVGPEGWESTWKSVEPPAPDDAEGIIKYIKLVFYDVLAAIGAAGNDVIQATDILDPPDLFASQGPHIHKIVGREDEIPDPKNPSKTKTVSTPMINARNMKIVVSGLLKGSLEAFQQGIPSTHTTWEMWIQRNEQKGQTMRSRKVTFEM